MEVALYQSSRGEMVLMPACLAPSRDVTRRFNALYRRTQFTIRDDEEQLIDLMLRRGFARVGPVQLAGLRQRNAPVGR